jgi:hypothetical protein
MKSVIKFISVIGIALTIVPAFLVFMGILTWDIHADLMLAGTILWFCSAPFWIKEKS